MHKIGYLDCQTGIAGDMCLGALVNSGVPLKYLMKELQKLDITTEYRLWEEQVYRQGQLATRVHVDLLKNHQSIDRHHSHDYRTRRLPEIELMIQQANLSSRATRWSLDTFRQLAIAEGTVHGVEPDKVHFHEVGSTDAIVDIVGTCLGLDWLGIETLYCSPMPMGGGTVWTSHGCLAVPVPAVIKLWEFRQVPIYSNSINKELVTPTGAAIAVTLVKGFCSHPPMKLQKVGLGAGLQELTIPNILKLWIGESTNEDTINSSEKIAVLETQIDDLNPQIIGYIFEKLFLVGAVDVFTQAVNMKKSRPGILLTVICPLERIVDCEKIIFTETTTLGIRSLIQDRSILDREIQEIDTDYGIVKVKIASQQINGQKTIINVQAEYEDCVLLAQNTNKPLQYIQQMVIGTWYKKYKEY
ncbi:nickel pincer cofactor biosynthesis protein LarC [Cyanobacterium sp. uoEpiScrs1]|uniref:nickel pincer cofactor biosynthesis protein LarC n=1 Tax=Cyanobacterium sp. uoEpiScrs1 TaxID=2976343 RepID=UPI00226AD330|nr:nickel pincer cofactor biosynthesis protein LarC [Cyanobacterium sp. uoEpiScrs1]